MTVQGLALRGEMVVLRLNCAAGALRMAATSLARRADTTYAYLITGAADCAAEISCPSHRLASLLMDDLPGVPGLVSNSSHPVLRYFQGVHEWQPGLLSAEELAVLARTSEPTVWRRVETMRREGRLIVRAVVEPALLGYRWKHCCG